MDSHQPLHLNPFAARNIVTVAIWLSFTIFLTISLESLGSPSLLILALAVLGSVAAVLASRGIKFEGSVLGGLLFVDIFAQSGLPRVSLSGQGFPIYLTEIGLILCVIGVLQRIAFTKQKFFEASPLSVALTVFMTIGSMRFVADCASRWATPNLIKTAIRDFATVYYAVFFFIAYSVSRHGPTRRFMERMLLAAIVALLPLRAFSIFFPNALTGIAIQGQELFAPRPDLTGSFLGFGCIYFLLRRDEVSRTPFVWLSYTGLALACFAEMMVGLSRATFVAFGAGLLLMLLARKGRVVRDILFFAVIGSVTLVAVEQITGVRKEERFTQLLADKFLSVTDIGSGSHSYSTDAGEAASGNTRFRTIWWQTVTDETLATAPLTGLGFGYDLAASFLQKYPFDLGEEFAARSPHSILFTVLGRTGLVGLSAFAVFLLTIGYKTLRCTLAVRQRLTSATDLSLWCGVIIIFSASCFGVMLEGPMAATVFWTMLALAARREVMRLAREKEQSPAAGEAEGAEKKIRAGALPPPLAGRPAHR